MNESKIVFSGSYSESDFKIMELEPDVANSIQQGETQGKNELNESFSVTIKGGGNEQCVLTTPHKSYCLEKIDTSNTVLLCKRSNQESYTVFGSCGTVLEVSVIYASHRVAGK